MPSDFWHFYLLPSPVATGSLLNRDIMGKHVLRRSSASWLFWVTAAFLVLTFLTGGASRSDALSLIVLRPVAVFALAFGLWRIHRRAISDYLFLYLMAAGIFALAVAHLIPLPPSIWRNLPGRELAIEVDRLAGLTGVWRPLSLVPSATLNALCALLVPCAVLVLVSQLERAQRFDLLPVMIGVGVTSGMLGLLQVLGSADGPLYFYRITNNGAAVGLFANRNHQAVFLACQFPMLAVYACAGVQTVQQERMRRWSALAIACVLIPLILVTGSRAGLIAAVLGISSAFFLYRRLEVNVPKKRQRENLNRRYLYVALAIAAMGIATVFMARAQAFERLIEGGSSDDFRIALLGPVASAGWQYFPFGSGIGSFVEVYQVHEPKHMLTLNFLNRAHNDWLETFMTVGLPGLLLLLAAVVGYMRCAWSNFASQDIRPRTRSFAGLGAVLILILALASAVDYPLRTPSLSCFFILAAIWLAAPQDSSVVAKRVVMGAG